jgi:hypothetical protein
MARKIKKQNKEHGNRSLQSQILYYSDLNILSYRSLFDANSIFLDSWLEDLSANQILAKTKLIWERYDFSKMTYKFY